MNYYKSDEYALSGGLILANVFSLIVFGYEKQHFGLILLNPLIFVILGFLIWFRKKVYIPSNSISYAVVEGAAARFFGICLMVLGAASFVVFNSGLVSQALLGPALYAQIFISIGLTIGVAVTKGEMLYRP